MSASKRMSIPLFLMAGVATVLIAFLVRDKRPGDSPVDRPLGALNEWEDEGGSLLTTRATTGSSGY